MIADIQSKFDV